MVGTRGIVASAGLAVGALATVGVGIGAGAAGMHDGTDDGVVVKNSASFTGVIAAMTVAAVAGAYFTKDTSTAIALVDFAVIGLCGTLAGAGAIGGASMVNHANG